MWWIIWGLLVVAAVATLVLLVLSLWRKVKALGREGEQALEILDRLDAASLEEPAEVERHRPGALREPETLGQARSLRARVAVERDEARALRLARAVTRWRDLRLIE